MLKRSFTDLGRLPHNPKRVKHPTVDSHFKKQILLISDMDHYDYSFVKYYKPVVINSCPKWTSLPL